MFSWTNYSEMGCCHEIPKIAFFFLICATISWFKILLCLLCCEQNRTKRYENYCNQFSIFILHNVPSFSELWFYTIFQKHDFSYNLNCTLFLCEYVQGVLLVRALRLVLGSYRETPVFGTAKTTATLSTRTGSSWRNLLMVWYTSIFLHPRMFIYCCSFSS